MDFKSFFRNLMAGLKLVIDFILDLTGLLITIIIIATFLIIIPILMLSSFLWEVGQNLASEASLESIDNDD